MMSTCHVSDKIITLSALVLEFDSVQYVFRLTVFINVMDDIYAGLKIIGLFSCCMV